MFNRQPRVRVMPVNFATDLANFDGHNQDIDANELMVGIKKSLIWLRQTIEENDSNDIDCYGAPIGKNYRDETVETLMQCFAHLQCAAIILSASFLLHQGDLTEDQFSHYILQKFNEDEDEN